MMSAGEPQDRVDAGAAWPETAHMVAELVSAEELSPSVRSMVFQTDSLRWLAGQYVELAVQTADGTARRPFSIAGAPDARAPGRVELAVSADEQSAATTAVRQLRVGSHVELIGPKGRFARGGPWDGPVVLVGTGTGVAPLRAMVQAELAERPSGSPILLLFGCRQEQDLLWAEEFARLAESNGRFRFAPTLSKPEPSWQGRQGYVQEHLAELVRELEPVRVLVCGQSEMVRQVRRVLDEELSYPEERISVQNYG
jgi:CDP-4-dehydro-6-deoxyglucose reductase